MLAWCHVPHVEALLHAVVWMCAYVARQIPGLRLIHECTIAAWVQYAV